jgi:flagellar secretion chaperone FliS
LKEITLQNVELSDIHDRPELITSLLYKKLLEKLDAAIMLLPQRRYFEANRAMQYCNDILTRLGYGIKYEAGVMADQLENLYTYMFDRVIEANEKKDGAILREIRRLVRELDFAWSKAMEQASNSASVNSGPQQAFNQRPNRAGGARLNPYQQRELQQEELQYQKEKQEILLKK